MDVASICELNELTTDNVYDKPLSDLKEAYKMLFGNGAMKGLSIQIGRNEKYISQIFSGQFKNEKIEKMLRRQIYNKISITKEIAV